MDFYDKTKVLEMLTRMVSEDGKETSSMPQMSQSALEYRKKKVAPFPWIIYGITEPESCFVKYVGFTSRPLGDRIAGHIAQAKRADLYPVSRWIRGLLLKGLTPEFKVLEEGYGGDWGAREKFWIKLCRFINKDLKNMTDGGEGTPGYKVTDAMRERMKKNHHSKNRCANARMVLCFENNLVYRSVTDASRHLGTISAGGIIRSIKEVTVVSGNSFRYFGCKRHNFHKDDPEYPIFRSVFETDESKY